MKQSEMQWVGGSRPRSGRGQICRAGALAALIAPSAAFAQQEIPVTDLSGDAPVDLGTIAVTATGFEQSVVDAPASISVVPGEAIQTSGSPT